MDKNQSKVSTCVMNNGEKHNQSEKIAYTFTNKILLQLYLTTRLQHIFNNNNSIYAFSCIFSNITEEETVTIIDKITNKSSSGYDCISNKML